MDPGITFRARLTQALANSSLGLLFGIAFMGMGCRTAAIRHVADPVPAVERLSKGGTIQAEADRLVRPLIENGKAFGMVVGVVTPDGTTHCFEYGRNGLPGEDRPPGADSLFQVGSVSKLFMASLVAVLVEEGQLRYEDTVRSILPAEVKVTRDVGALTVRQLLTHTTGLPREPRTITQFWSFARYLVTGRNLYAHLNKRYIYAYIGRKHLPPPERRKFEYSNIGIGLLANLIEVKTGRPATDLILEKVCRPLGMNSSTFNPKAEQLKSVALGHVGNQACWRPARSPLKTWDMGPIMSASAGMYSSASDLLLFTKANLGFLHHPLEPILASNQQVQVRTERGAEGHGWIINYFDEDRIVLVFKDGMLSGYRSYIGFDRAARVGVVVLTNNFDWDDHVGHNLLLPLAKFFRPTSSVPVSTSGAPGS